MTIGFYTVSMGGSNPAGCNIACELGLSTTATICAKQSAVKKLALVFPGTYNEPMPFNYFWGKSCWTEYQTFQNAGLWSGWTGQAQSSLPCYQCTFMYAVAPCSVTAFCCFGCGPVNFFQTQDIYYGFYQAFYSPINGSCAQCYALQNSVNGCQFYLPGLLDAPQAGYVQVAPPQPASYQCFPPGQQWTCNQRFWMAYRVNNETTAGWSCMTPVGASGFFEGGCQACLCLVRGFRISNVGPNFGSRNFYICPYSTY